jgi:hypothetical protein
MGVKNAKPKLLGGAGTDTHAGNLTGSAGTDTHAASLGGSAPVDTHGASLGGSITAINPVGDIGVVAACGALNSGLTTINRTIGTRTITPTKSTNKIYVAFQIHIAQLWGDTTTIRVREGASNIIATQAITSGNTARTISGVMTNASVAAHTFTYEIIHSGTTGYQYGNGGTTDTNPDVIPPVMMAILFDYDDTHVANLTGSAGTDTHVANLTGSAGTDTHAAGLTGSAGTDTHSTRSVFPIK